MDRTLRASAVLAAVLAAAGLCSPARAQWGYPGGYGGYGWGGWGGMGMGSASTTVSEYTVGTLVVDIYAAKSKALIWRGVATDELKAKPEKREKQLTKATDKLLKDFPPGRK